MKKFAILLIVGVLALVFMLNGLRAVSFEFNGTFSRDSHGETVVFTGNNQDIERLIYTKRVEVLSTQTVAGVEIIYGFSTRLMGGVLVDGEKINIQIARRGSTITVGSPLIFGSF